MAALTYDEANPAQPPPHRGVLLRVLDVLAERQMRHSHCVIRRAQMLEASMTGVTQPSSVNERSSTRPCDR